MNSNTVLIVEDEALIALDLLQTIEDMGMAVEGPYSTTAVALKSLPARSLSCAILDVRVLDGDIFPVADELVLQGVPIIFHSGAVAPPELRARYPEALVCQKPSFPDTIREAIMSATGARAGDRNTNTDH